MWDQLGVQVIGVIVTLVYAGILTLGLLILVEKTIGLRLNEREEMAGMDHAQHGERQQTRHGHEPPQRRSGPLVSIRQIVASAVNHPFPSSDGRLASPD